MATRSEPAAPAAIAPAYELQSNARWEGASPGPLTVVVPFFNYEVLPLAQRLLDLARTAGVKVPLVFVDDGSSDVRPRQALWALLQDANQPCLLATLTRNVGRGTVRNVLCRLAHTQYLLYLDADMWPDREDFLHRYLTWIEQGAVDVIYGGRSAEKAILTGREHQLHRQMTALREALPAEVRRQSPAFHFYSCNFVVRREILEVFPLDEKFTGWGWEDCEWAARVAQRYTIRHEDNPASHLGLLTPQQILKKYDESVENFRRILGLQPEMVKLTSLYRASVAIGQLRLGSLVALVSRWVATSPLLPNSLRIRGLMFYKAALYAPVVEDRRS